MCIMYMYNVDAYNIWIAIRLLVIFYIFLDIWSLVLSNGLLCSHVFPLKFRERKCRVAYIIIPQAKDEIPTKTHQLKLKLFHHFVCVCSGYAVYEWQYSRWLTLSEGSRRISHELPNKQRMKWEEEKWRIQPNQQMVRRHSEFYFLFDLAIFRHITPASRILQYIMHTSYV